MRPCDYGICNEEYCTDKDCLSDTTTMEDIMNKVTLTLINTTLYAQYQNKIVGERFRTREQAMDMYMDQASMLEEQGLLSNESCIER